MSEGFNREDLETSEATVSIFNNLNVPASLIAYSGNITTSNISITHGGVDLSDSPTVQIDGGGEAYGFAIGPEAGPGFSGDLTGFDPLDSAATVTLFRTGTYTPYDDIPDTISGTVGAIIVGNDRNNGQVYSTFLNRPLPPEVEPPVDPPVVDPPVVVTPDIDNPTVEPSVVVNPDVDDPEETPDNEGGGDENLVAADDPDVETTESDSLCQPASPELIASRSGEERGEDEGPECTVPRTGNILQIEDDINGAPEVP